MGFAENLRGQGSGHGSVAVCVLRTVKSRKRGAKGQRGKTKSALESEIRIAMLLLVRRAPSALLVCGGRRRGNWESAISEKAQISQNRFFRGHESGDLRGTSAPLYVFTPAASSMIFTLVTCYCFLCIDNRNPVPTRILHDFKAYRRTSSPGATQRLGRWTRTHHRRL